MRHLFDPFVWLDNFVQKRFDSVCFFLMRRFGIRKSLMRYTLLTIVILATAASFFLGFSWGKRDAGSTLFYIAMIAFFTMEQRVSKQADEEAEARPGTMSSIDRQNPFVLGILKALSMYEITSLLLFAASSPEQRRLGWSLEQVKLYRLFDVIWWFTTLLLLYLRRTPMNPPPEKVRESVGTLSPARL